MASLHFSARYLFVVFTTASLFLGDIVKTEAQEQRHQEVPSTRAVGVCEPRTFVEGAFDVALDKNRVSTDSVVPEGAELHFTGQARRVHVRSDCSLRKEMLPFKWSVEYVPNGGMPRTESLGAGTPELNFRAKLGRYRIKLIPDASGGGDKLVSSAVRWLWVLRCGDWLSIGPEVSFPTCLKNNVCGTGVVLDVAFDPSDPNRMFVGTRGGGVWRSDDAANSWYPVADHKGLPAGLAVGRLAMAPGRPGDPRRRLFAGTGSPDGPQAFSSSTNGLYISDDLGDTWSHTGDYNSACANPNDGPWGIITRIVIDSDQPDRVFVSSLSGGVFRSDDRGNCWTDITANLTALANLPVYDLALVHAAAGPKLYAAVSPTGSTICDAVLLMDSPVGIGSSWSKTLPTPGGDCPQLDSPIRTLLAHGTLFLVGPVLYAMVSTSQNHVWPFRLLGGFWTKGNEPTANGCEGGNNGCNAQCQSTDLAIAANPSRVCDVYVTTTKLGLRSTDCGQNWQQFSDDYHHSGDPHVLMFHPSNGRLFIGNDHGLAAIDTSSLPNPKLACTTMPPATSVPVNVSNGMATDEFYGMRSSNNYNWPNGVIGALQDNGTKLRIAGTTDWIFEVGGDGGAATIDSSSSNIAYASYIDSTSILSSGGGAAPLYRGNNVQTDPIDINLSPMVATRAISAWADPIQKGALLIRAPEGLLYASDAATVSGQIGNPPTGKLAAWTCIDPTPLDPTDSVVDVDFAASSGVYYVAMAGALGQYGLTAGGIYRVTLKTNAPSATPCAQPLPDSQLEITTVLDPARNLGMSHISVDVLHDDSLYATTSINFSPVRVVHITRDSVSGEWNVVPIGAGFPAWGATGNFWQDDTYDSKYIAADPVTDGLVYIGTGDGIFTGRRQGADDSNWTWTYNQSFPATQVSQLTASRGILANRSIVRASTFGRGVWERKNCPLLGPSVHIPPNEHYIRIPIPRPDPARVRHEVVLPIEYSFTLEEAPAAWIRVVPTLNGQPSAYFATEPVRVAPAESTTFVSLAYAGRGAPIGYMTDSISVQLVDAHDRILAQDSVPLRFRWSHVGTRSIFVRGEVGVGEGAPAPLKFNIPVSSPEGRRSVPLGDQFLERNGDAITLDAPPSITTAYGRALFDRWIVTRDEELGSTRPSSLAIDAPLGPRLKLRATADLILVATYKLEEGPTG